MRFFSMWEIFKPQINKTKQWMQDHPKIAWPLFLGLIAFVALGIVTGVFTFFLNFHESKPSLPEVRETNPEIEVLSCADYCSDFKDLEKWLGSDQLVVDKDRNLFKAPADNARAGAIMFYDKEVYTSFKAKFEIIPLSNDEANIVIQFGSLLRCMIGDGNYKTLGCQINKLFPTEKADWTYVTVDGEDVRNSFQNVGSKGFEPKTKLIITWQQEIEENSRMVNVGITLNYFPPDSNTPTEHSFKQNFKLPFVGKDLKGKIGVGLLDPRRTGAIEAKFLDFQLDLEKI